MIPSYLCFLPPQFQPPSDHKYWNAYYWKSSTCVVQRSTYLQRCEWGKEGTRGHAATQVSISGTIIIPRPDGTRKRSAGTQKDTDVSRQSHAGEQRSEFRDTASLHPVFWGSPFTKPNQNQTAKKPSWFNLGLSSHGTEHNGEMWIWRDRWNISSLKPMLFGGLLWYSNG